ncbi:MAG: hypothetical protein QXN69_03490 [Candidatus Methanomethylicaceae archaeon]
MIDDFGETGLKIVIYLSKKGRAKLSDFKLDLRMGSAAVYRALKILYEYKVIGEESEGVARYFFLTEKGKKVADLINQVEVLLQNP